MIDWLDELNRVLIATGQLRDGKGTARLASVIDLCKSTVIEGRKPDHEKSIEFARMLGMLTQTDNAISITEHGDTFLAFNRDSNYELSSEQKGFLMRSCFLHGRLRTETREVLLAFSPRIDNSDQLSWSVTDSSSFEALAWLPIHLEQLGLLDRTPDGWNVNAAFTATVSAFLGEGAGWSEEQLREYLQEKQAVGAIAENLMLEAESQRLKQAGHVLEATCVRNISKVRVNAGYDLESFDARAADLNYNRFIEVKGARTKKVRFFWSDNEMSIARKFGPRYWIYFQGGIDPRSGKASVQPRLFQDPARTLLGDPKFTKTPQGVIVEGA
jgi:hypothetical protein